MMKKLYALLALSAACAAPAMAQVAPPAPVTVAPVVDPASLVRVVMTTSEGPIVLALEKDRAPLTTANFLRYVDLKRLDGVTFYRAMKLGQGTGLIQGGLKNEPKLLLKPVPHEPTTKTGLSHVEGTISLARFAPGTATADFFITVGPVLSLDANPAGTGDNQGFAAFGHVVEGMDVVKRILEAPTSATAGVGVMKGQMIAAPVKILTVRRVK